MIYTFKEILEMHGSLIYELRRNAPSDEKERYAYFLGVRAVLFELFEFQLSLILYYQSILQCLPIIT